MIVSIAANIHATGPEQGLTIYEMRAIVNLMVIRVTQSPFRRYRTHPVSYSIPPADSISTEPDVFDVQILLFSYMGRQCGRIIQALYDSEALNIQYSKLFSFDDEKTAPVELFVRYNLSKPVEPENPALCPR